MRPRLSPFPGLLLAGAALAAPSRAGAAPPPRDSATASEEADATPGAVVAAEDAAGAAPVAPTPPGGATKAPPGTPDPPAGSRWSDRKTLAVVAGGVGVIGLGLGAVFGMMTVNLWSTAKRECTASCGAGSQALNDRSAAYISGTLADVGFVAGGVLIAGAAVLWFTAPSGAQVQVAPTASAQGAGLTLRGTF